MSQEKENMQETSKQHTPHSNAAKLNALSPESDLRIILASSSPRRIELMKNLGFKFEVIPSNIEEMIDANKTPAQMVIELAKKKGRAVYESAVAKSQSDSSASSTTSVTDSEGKAGGGRTMILSADTTVVLDQRLIGKPTSEDDARLMLRMLSGRVHDVFTGVAIIVKGPQDKAPVEYLSFEMSHVFFRGVTDAEINSYVATGEPMDKAGAYALQGIGSAFVQKIEGCFTNVIGLPIPLVVSMMRRAGISVLGDAGRR
jgi:septum formation protein